jgi:hypothetical protein
VFFFLVLEFGFGFVGFSILFNPLPLFSSIVVIAHWSLLKPPLCCSLTFLQPIMSDEKVSTVVPEDTNFKQQRLAAWQPLLTPCVVIGLFIAVIAICTPLGVVIMLGSDSVCEIFSFFSPPLPFLIISPFASS